MNDVMIDLETMDNSPTSAIVSIGAVQCNIITGEIGDTFYRVVDLKGQQEAGLTIDTDTLYWWMDQSKAARKALLVPGKISIKQMCREFTLWLRSLKSPEKLRYWGNGANFDNAIVENAFKKLNMEFPIPFWNSRDMRTLVGFYPTSLQIQWRRTNVRQGELHNAKDDAIHQVKFCSHILQELGVEEIY